MKNNKPVSGKQPIATFPTKNPSLPSSVLRGSKTVSDKSVEPTTTQKKSAASIRSTASSSQESLSWIGTSVRRKTPKAAPIRMIDNLQPARKATARSRLALGNMRRAVSKDSVDCFASKDREKENVKVPRNSRNSCITILQMEKEKAQMEKQISELVKNAESKKAEIATLKMEINKLKDLKSDDAVDQLRQELESVQLENQELRERLVQLGVPLEMTALSDNQKEQILIQRSLSGSFLNLNKGQQRSSSPEGGRSSCSGAEWERGSSGSESVACLQDKIVQMEETHHSTNEELQATLQELTDLQDQLADLQLENERMSDEKAVLLESLCSQTDRLEECRTQVAQLKQLLFEGESRLAHPLQQEESEPDERGPRALRERVRLLETTVESVGADKRLTESQLREAREQLSAGRIELSQLRLLLESEQQKVVELQREREAGDGNSELQALLQESRRDKAQVEERALRLQEQLALSQREATRLKEQLHQALEEGVVAQNQARGRLSDLEVRLAREREEQAVLRARVCALEEAAGTLTLQCRRHLEEERALRDALQEKDGQLQEAEEARRKHRDQVEEWTKFQADLLTAVRVANDFKAEAVREVQKLALRNKELSERNSALAVQVAALKAAASGGSGPTDDPPKRRPQQRADSSSVRALIASIENASKQQQQQQTEGPEVSSCSSSSSSLNSITSDSRISTNSGLSNNDIYIKPTEPGDAKTVATSDADLAKPHPVASLFSSKLDPLRRNSCGGDHPAERKDPLCSLLAKGGGGSKRNALLKWCQNKTRGYKGIDITNFSSSWNDGLAFCALLHSYLPHLVPYDELNGKDKKRNFTLAFQAAESVGIKTTLEIDDLTHQERPDWQCIMGYVTSVYKHFET